MPDNEQDFAAENSESVQVSDEASVRKRETPENWNTPLQMAHIPPKTNIKQTSSTVNKQNQNSVFNYLLKYSLDSLLLTSR